MADCFNNRPTEIFKCRGQNLRGNLWSTYGKLLLSNADNKLTVFESCNDTRLDVKHQVDVTSKVNDFTWRPESSCFAFSSEENPIYMYNVTDKPTDMIEFHPLDDTKQLVSPQSLTFDDTGTSLYCGFDNFVKVFDVKTQYCFETQRTYEWDHGCSGVITCITFNPFNGCMYACGSENTFIGIYYEPQMCLHQLLNASNKVTHLKFTQDGNYLYAGTIDANKSHYIVCWDVRKWGTSIFDWKCDGAFGLERMYFDLDPAGRVLMTGSIDGTIEVWDLKNMSKPSLYKFEAHDDAVQGLNFHPSAHMISTNSTDTIKLWKF